MKKILFYTAVIPLEIFIWMTAASFFMIYILFIPFHFKRLWKKQY